MNREKLLNLLEIRVADMERAFDRGCGYEYCVLKGQVERIARLLEEEEDCRHIIEFLKELDK